MNQIWTVLQALLFIFLNNHKHRANAAMQPHIDRSPAGALLVLLPARLSAAQCPAPHRQLPPLLHLFLGMKGANQQVYCHTWSSIDPWGGFKAGDFYLQGKHFGFSSLQTGKLRPLIWEVQCMRLKGTFYLKKHHKIFVIFSPWLVDCYFALFFKMALVFLPPVNYWASFCT